MRVLACTLLFLAGAAQADELLINTVSFHSHRSYVTQTTNWFDRDTGEYLYTTEERAAYNNINPGLGYRTSDGWSAGFYYNSYRKMATYAAKDWMFNEHWGVMVGVATGYKDVTGYALSPIGGFEYKHRLNETWTANVLALPPTGKTVGVVHFVLSKEIGK